jgi:lipopolysaccharide transport system permease protein
MVLASGWPQVFRYRDLLFNLVATELKVKYRGSALGFLWSLLNPLALILIYTIAFTYILQIKIERFAVFLIAGILPWQFFAGSALAATISLMVNANLLKKVQFPRLIIPAATVLFNLIQMIIALAVFLPAVVIIGRHVPWTLVFYPVVLGLQALFVVGVAMGLSALTVVFRDLRHLTEVGLTMLFWFTPILYSVSMVPAWLRPIFLANPMSAFVTAYQDITYWGRPLSAGLLLTMVGWTVGVLLAGGAIFRWRAPYLAEDL